MVHLFCDSSFRSFPISIALFSAWVRSRAKARHICLCCQDEWPGSSLPCFFRCHCILANACGYHQGRSLLPFSLVQKSAEWKWWHQVQSCRGWGPKIQKKKLQSQNPPCLHHRPPFISMVSKCKVNTLPPPYKGRNWGREWQYDGGHPTDQWQSREGIAGFRRPDFFMYPWGSTALVLHQNHHELLNQD